MIRLNSSHLICTDSKSIEPSYGQNSQQHLPCQRGCAIRFEAATLSQTFARRGCFNPSSLRVRFKNLPRF